VTFLTQFALPCPIFYFPCPPEGGNFLFSIRPAAPSSMSLREASSPEGTGFERRGNLCESRLSSASQTRRHLSSALGGFNVPFSIAFCPFFNFPFFVVPCPIFYFSFSIFHPVNPTKI
jgi:hypothetical protein